MALCRQSLRLEPKSKRESKVKKKDRKFWCQPSNDFTLRLYSRFPSSSQGCKLSWNSVFWNRIQFLPYCLQSSSLSRVFWTHGDNITIICDRINNCIALLNKILIKSYSRCIWSSICSRLKNYSACKDELLVYLCCSQRIDDILSKKC